MVKDGLDKKCIACNSIATETPRDLRRNSDIQNPTFCYACFALREHASEVFEEWSLPIPSFMISRLIAELVRHQNAMKSDGHQCFLLQKLKVGDNFSLMELRFILKYKLLDTNLKLSKIVKSKILQFLKTPLSEHVEEYKESAFFLRGLE